MIKHTQYTFQTRSARAAFVATLPDGTRFRLIRRSGCYTQPGRGIVSVLEYIVEVAK